MKGRLWRHNVEAKVLRQGLNPGRSAWPSPCSSAHEEVDCLNFQAQLLLPWAAEATATGHQAVRHPSWGHALGPAPGLGCPAEHLSFTHFIKHLLHDALPASLLSKNKHRSPRGRGINHQGWQNHHEPGSPLPGSQPHQVSSDAFRAGWAACVRACVPYVPYIPPPCPSSLPQWGLSFRTQVGRHPSPESHRNLIKAQCPTVTSIQSQSDL